jgi:nucleoside-diphosphate-sugar epimerase
MTGGMRPWVILGCGYTGERLAARLVADGVPVVAVVRRADAAGPLRARLGAAADVRVADVHADALTFPADAIVVDSVPPDPPRAPHASRVVAALAAAGGGRLVYLSTTGVYPRGDGSWVNEDTPVAPDGERGAARVLAERVYLDAAAADPRIDAVCLRVAAIYGPGRGVAERLKTGAYRVPGDGQHFISRIHVDDLVAAIRAAGQVPTLPRRVYVVADDDPCRARDHADALAARLGLPPPPSVPLEQLSPLGRELATSNRRVSNARLKAELGVALLYPSWRDAPSSG